MHLNLIGKSVLVLGLGLSGCSAARLLLANGCKVWGADDKLIDIARSPQIQGLIKEGMGLFHSREISHFDLVIASPGISPMHPVYAAACHEGIPVMGEAELAITQLSKSHLCIGISGTNGKTTVTYLLEHILNANGRKAKALGNSGIPLSSFLIPGEQVLEPGTVIVAELSSFQLETMKTRVLDAAILLNITLDHLDRYASFEHYAKAKIHLFDCLKEGGIGYIQKDCYHAFREELPHYPLKTYGFENCHLYTDGEKIFLEGIPVCKLPSAFQNSKSHDIENILAAFAMAMEMKVEPEGIMDSLSAFKKPPHRLEFIQQINGISFIDDSKATNTDAVIRAVQSLSSSIVLIAGGVDKGGSYQVWKPHFNEKVHAICTIGQAADKISRELGDSLPIYPCESLYEAVITAAKLAKSGDVVLLSPGCSSYDMFSSYAHRGKHFQEIVQALAIKEKL